MCERILLTRLVSSRCVSLISVRSSTKLVVSTCFSSRIVRVHMSALCNMTDRGHPCRMPFVETNDSPTKVPILKRLLICLYIPCRARKSWGAIPILLHISNVIDIGTLSNALARSIAIPNPGSPSSSALSRYKEIWAKAFIVECLALAPC